MNFLLKIMLKTLLIIIFVQSNLFATENVKIILKINDEIVTNIDIEKEYIYIASWAGMLRRLKYTDFQPTWELVPLPEDINQIGDEHETLLSIAIDVNNMYEKAYLSVGQIYYSKGDYNKSLDIERYIFDNSYPRTTVSDS